MKSLQNWELTKPFSLLSLPFSLINDTKVQELIPLPKNKKWRLLKRQIADSGVSIASNDLHCNDYQLIIVFELGSSICFC